MNKCKHYKQEERPILINTDSKVTTIVHICDKDDQQCQCYCNGDKCKCGFIPEIITAPNGTILRDILTNGDPIKLIIVRHYVFGEDSLFGYCSWDGEKIIPMDGDSYPLNEEILQYQRESNDVLVYWIETGFNSKEN